MRFSKSLLGNKEICDRLYKNGIEKSMDLLEYIFGFNFKDNDNVKGSSFLDEEEGTYSHNIMFNFKGQEFEAIYRLENEGEDILREVLSISEVVDERVKIILSNDDGKPTGNLFWDCVKKVQDYLESRFEINFTPLDPEEKDARIHEIRYDEQKLTWETVFLQDYREGEFVIIYKDCRDLLIRHNKKHLIFLD